jgi:hypothetical protein
LATEALAIMMTVVDAHFQVQAQAQVTYGALEEDHGPILQGKIEL